MSECGSLVFGRLQVGRFSVVRVDLSQSIMHQLTPLSNLFKLLIKLLAVVTSMDITIKHYLMLNFLITDNYLLLMSLINMKQIDLIHNTSTQITEKSI